MEIRRRAIPANGNWAAPRRHPIHAVLVVHAVSEAGLEEACRVQRTFLDEAAGGVVELPGSMQTGYRPDGNNEPFGFHDGIAQPSIAAISGDGVPTGEFILGYQNHFQIIPPTPVVPAELDRDAVLPRLANPYHAPARSAISASTAPTSCTASCSRMSRGSGSS